MGAVLAVPLMFACFGAVEFHHVTTLRREVQAAVDSAGLSVARSGERDEARIQAMGRAALISAFSPRLAAQELLDSNFVLVDGVVTAEAVVGIRPIISSVIFGGTIDVKAAALIEREGKLIEVALVLDTTGSMGTVSAGTGKRRIELLEEAAVAFVDKMQTHATAMNRPNAVKIAVVPFSSTVNVGAQHQGAVWMDGDGLSPVNRTPHVLFWDIDTDTGTKTAVLNPKRFDLFASLGFAWRGCVESRPAPHDVQDTAPDRATPATLFPPYFAPDELQYIPDDADHRGGLLDDPTAPNDTDDVLDNNPDLRNDYLRESDWVGYVNPADRNLRYRFERALNRLLFDWSTTPKAEYFYRTGEGRALQGYVGRYAVARVTDGSVPPPLRAAVHTNGASPGPNKGCAVEPIAPLNATLSEVRAAVADLPIGGSTNIPMGLMWGWHTLSPNAPFANGTAYGREDVSKVIILMTDGDNSLNRADNTNGSEYSGVGYWWQNRLGAGITTSAQARAALDARLGVLCSNIAARGITVYALALEAPGAATLLTPCAVNGGTFFNVQQASQLDAACAQIADQIASLHIAR